VKFLETNKEVFCLVWFFLSPDDVVSGSRVISFLSCSVVLTAYVFSFEEVKLNMVRRILLNF